MYFNNIFIDILLNNSAKLRLGEVSDRNVKSWHVTILIFLVSTNYGGKTRKEEMNFWFGVTILIIE